MHEGPGPRSIGEAGDADDAGDARTTQRSARLAAGRLRDITLTREGLPRKRRPKQKRHECFACGRRLPASAFEMSRKRPGQLMSICMACHYPDADPQDRAMRATMPYWWDRRPASPWPRTPKPRRKKKPSAPRPAHTHPIRLEEDLPDWALPF